MIRVLVVHEHCLVGHCIGAALTQTPGIYVSGYATPETVFVMVAEHDCDIVLLSSRLPDSATVRISRRLRNQCTAVKVLVIDLFAARPLILTYLEEGVSGYITEQESFQNLVDKLHGLMRDEFPLPPSIAAGLITRLAVLKQRVDAQGMRAVTDRQHLWQSLTEREQDVLKLLVHDFENSRIATMLCIQPGTVKHHVHNILRKLGVNNRNEATLIAKQFMKFEIFNSESS